MGVGRSMKIFMEAMQNSMTYKGFSGKILNTPMGPFKWDDNLQMWVNQNNGFAMPNISMQDMMMLGYETLSGGNGGPSCIYTLDTFNTTQAIEGNTPTAVPSVSLSIAGSITCVTYFTVSTNNPESTGFTYEYSTNGGSSWTSFIPNGTVQIPIEKNQSLGADVRLRLTADIGGGVAHDLTFTNVSSTPNTVFGSISISWSA